MIELSRSQVDDLRQLLQFCAELDAELVIIGAIAYQIHFPEDARHTSDIDLAVALDLDDFEDLTERLGQAGWTQTESREHRWRAAYGTLLDLIPAGEGLRRAKQIIWPKSQFTMSLVGFDHVFSDSKAVTLAEDLAVRVIPPPVLMLMKIVAFLDDQYGRQKDLSDIRALMSRYAAESERLFSDTAVAAGLDFTLANASLLGADMDALCSEEERDVVRRFVEAVRDESKPAWLAFVNAAPPGSLGRNEQTALAQLQTFSESFGRSRQRA